jgi:hypothetical protein
VAAEAEEVAPVAAVVDLVVEEAVPLVMVLVDPVLVVPQVIVV